MGFKRGFAVSLLLVTVTAFSSLNAQTTKFKAVFMEAKENDKEVLVVLKNGSTYSGKVVSIGDNSAGIETEDGLFNFNYDRIREVSFVDPSDPTSRWYRNPAANKLFLTQSGRMLEKGSGYYQNTYIFFSNFSYGLTDNFSISAGLSTVPGLSLDEQLIILGVKGGLPVGDLSLAVNANYYNVVDSGEGVTTIFGSATYTKRRLDLTVGAGVGMVDGNTSDPLFILGAQYRVSQRFALLTENFVLPAIEESEPLNFFGGRIIGSKTAIDLGFFTTADAGGTLVPWVSFAIKL